MIALFSINPEFVDKIFAGEKGYEYRKAIFRGEVRKIVVYCTKPVGRIVGEFDVEEVIEDSPSNIWRKTCDLAGINKASYKAYFGGRKVGYAISIGEKKQYTEAVDPSDVFGSFFPPQSFMYLSDKDYERCLMNTSIGDAKSLKTETSRCKDC